MKNGKVEKNIHFFNYQNEYLADRSMIKILEKSRRIGGTYMQAYEDVQDIVLESEYTPGRPVKNIYFSSKDELAGREYIDYCKMWAKVFNALVKEEENDTGVIDEKDGFKTMWLDFENGGKITALSSSPSAFNSKGGKIVWDEAALHKDQKEMWKGAKPAALWGYPVRILSTHKGKKTLFYKFIKDIEKGKVKWAHHKITIQRAVADGLADKIVGKKLTDEERQTWLDDLRKDCNDEDMWNEDFCCIPRDSTTAFITYDLLNDAIRDDILVDTEDFGKLKGKLYLGWDPASASGDQPAVIVLEKLGDKLTVRDLQVLKEMTTPQQKRVASKYLKCKNLIRACIDKTGMGIPIVEDMQEWHGKYRVEGITFTQASKELMAVCVKEALEDRRLFIPDDERLKEACHNIKKIITSTGNVRFDADRTEKAGHADLFWALALAVYAADAKDSGEVWVTSEKISNSIWNDYTDRNNYYGFM